MSRRASRFGHGSLALLALLAGCGPVDESGKAAPETSSLPPSASAPAGNSAAPNSATPSTPNTTAPGASTGESAADPLVAALGRLAEPQVAANYPAVRSAAEAAGFKGDAGYQQVLFLQAAGMMALQSGSTDDAYLIFGEAYRSAVKVDENETGEAPEPYRPLLANTYYNGACALAIDGDAAAAATALEKAIALGFDDFDQLKQDGDLASVRALPDFGAKLDGWIAAAEEAKSFPFEFVVTDLDGTSRSLAEMKGKVVIVDFWGTWCPPCRAEIPSFVKLQEQYGEQGLQIIGLNYERGEPSEAEPMIREFMTANSMNYPCAIGTPEIMAQVPNFQGYPTTLFIGRDGKVKDVTVGLHPYEALEERVVRLLAAEAASE
ncbi:MAG TPA: redoxin domain-containing protein [Pirellulaceae bacterium]|nr:redoxin domain-containing protein [Pirellulaceae bacterium]